MTLVQQPLSVPAGNTAGTTPVTKADVLNVLNVNANPQPLITIVAYGIPGPQGSKTQLPNGAMRESSKKVKPWRRNVADAATEATTRAAAWLGLDQWTPLDCALEVEMAFTLHRPAVAIKQRRTHHTTYPDLSKLARSTEDALTTARVWADDARVCRYRDLSKTYVGLPGALTAPGVVIRIYPATPALETP